MSLETEEDLVSFFDTDDFATTAHIVSVELDTNNHPIFDRAIKVIFDEDTQEVGIYSDTDVAAVKPSFLCKSADLAGVHRGLRVTFPNLEAWEDGYGKTYEVTPRIINEGVDASRVYLKEL